MKQIKITMLLITASIVLCGCPNNDDGHRYITFVNKSEREIACQKFCISGHVTNEDMLFQCSMPAVGISSDSSYNFRSLGYSGWEAEFTTGGLSYAQFLVMDAELYDKYIKPPNCDTIRKYVPILHRYQLKLEDLQRMNWTVVYPPEE